MRGFMTNSYLEHLKEFITSPSSGKEEIDFFNMKVYTSNSLKLNLKKVTKKYASNNTKNIINSLIDNGKLIPVFISKTIIDYIKKYRKLKSHSFATTYKGKIYLFLDTFYSFLKLSSVNEKKLFLTIIHELMHLAEQKNQKEFFSINYKIYLGFYKDFFSEYLKVDKSKIEDKDIHTLIKRMTNKKVINFITIYNPLFNKLYEYSKYDKDTITDLFKEFIDYLDKFYERFTSEVPHDIWKAGQYAYSNLTGGKLNQTIGQEFWSPSEIISILTELNPKHEVIEKNIKLLK
jgi:hypothetical protein